MEASPPELPDMQGDHSQAEVDVNRAKAKLRLEIKKIRTEIKKIELEILNLRSPFRRSPALWITTATTLLAIVGFIWQAQYSKNEYVLSQIQMKEALEVKEDAEKKVVLVEGRKKKLEEEISARKTEYEVASRRLENAKRLLAAAEPQVSEELKSQIRGFEKEGMTFEEQKDFYDPTGKFPNHVPR